MSMQVKTPRRMRRLALVSGVLLVLLIGAVLIGISTGSTANGLKLVLDALLRPGHGDSLADTIVWRIRLPRVLMAALVGATLSLGGLVFQALLRNVLAEPYILGISGGAAVGAIIGILLGLARFPGVFLTAFGGSMATMA